MLWSVSYPQEYKQNLYSEELALIIRIMKVFQFRMCSNSEVLIQNVFGSECVWIRVCSDSECVLNNNEFKKLFCSFKLKVYGHEDIHQPEGKSLISWQP